MGCALVPELTLSHSPLQLIRTQLTSTTTASNSVIMRVEGSLRCFGSRYYSKAFSRELPEAAMVVPAFSGSFDSPSHALGLAQDDRRAENLPCAQAVGDRRDRTSSPRSRAIGKKAHLGDAEWRCCYKAVRRLVRTQLTSTTTISSTVILSEIRVPACRDEDESKDPQDVSAGDTAARHSRENSLKLHWLCQHSRGPSTHPLPLRGIGLPQDDRSKKFSLQRRK
jgi:hypothetical protein